MTDTQTGTMPEMAYVALPVEREVGIVKRGEMGYYKTDWGAFDTFGDAQAIADQKNERMGISKAMAKAMMHGSMFGWHTPGADPALWEDKEDK